MDKLWVGSPGKVVYHGCIEVPSAGVALYLGYFHTCILVAEAYFVLVLQVTGASYDIVLIEGDFHIKIAPYPIELTADVFGGIPAAVVIFGQFGIPLAHGERYPVGAVSTSTANHHRSLSGKVHTEDGT